MLGLPFVLGVKSDAMAKNHPAASNRLQFIQYRRVFEGWAGLSPRYGFCPLRFLNQPQMRSDTPFPPPHPPPRNSPENPQQMRGILDRGKPIGLQ